MAAPTFSQSGGLQMFYNALSYRQAEKLRQEQEAELKRQQEEARKQQAAANKHNAFASTLQTIGTVGGALIGGFGGPAGSFAGAATGAALGNAAASGLMAIAPNIAGTQPAADNPYYNAPSDAQRAMTAINSGLQIASAYETNLKQSWLKENQLNMQKETIKLSSSGKIGDALALTDAGDGQELAKIWDSIGVSAADLPWFISKDELNALASEEYVRLGREVFPVIEMRDLEAQYQGIDLVEAVGGTTRALELTSGLLETKGDQSKVAAYLETLSPAERAAVEPLSKLPYFIQAKAHKNIYTLAGEDAKALKARREKIAEKATENFNADVKANISSVVKLHDQISHGGTEYNLDKNRVVSDYLAKIGVLNATEFTPEEFIAIYQMQIGFDQEKMAAATARQFSDMDRVSEAFAYMANIDPRYSGAATLFEQKIRNDVYGYVPQQFAGAETSSAAQSNTTTAKTPVSAGQQASESSETQRVNVPDLTATAPVVQDVPSVSDTVTAQQPANLTAEASQPISQKQAEEIADQNVLAQAQGESTGLAQQLGGLYPTADMGAAQLSTIRQNNIAVPTDAAQGVPLDTRMTAQELGVDPVEFSKSVAAADQQDAIARSTPVPGGGTQNTDTTPVAVKQVDQTKEGLKVWMDQYGRQFSELTITIPYQWGRWSEIQQGGEEDTFFINIPTVVNKTGQILSDEEAAAMVDFEDPRDFNTGKRLPVFATEEEAVQNAIQRSKYLGREDYKGPVNPKKATSEDYFESVGNYQKTDDFVATSDRQGMRQRLVDAKANGPFPEYVGTPAVPSNPTLRNLLENSDGTFQPIDTPTTAERVDRDIANAKIDRRPFNLNAENMRANPREMEDQSMTSFQKYLAEKERLARQQEALRNEQATPIGPVQRKEADRAAGVSERYRQPGLGLQTLNEYYAKQDLRSALDATPGPKLPSYMQNEQNNTLQNLATDVANDPYYQMGKDQLPVYPESRVNRERIVQPKEGASLDKALKAEGLEDMAGVARDIIQLESGGDEEAANRMGSSAYGLFQLTDDTFKRYAPSGAKRGNQKAELAAAVAMLKDNKSYLEKNEYLPTFTNVYVLHHFGKGGINLLKADPDDLITDVMYTNSNTGERTKLIDAGTLAQNPWLNSSMTVGEMLEAIKNARERGQFGSTGGAA